jgi:hypothetical protein
MLLRGQTSEVSAWRRNLRLLIRVCCRLGCGGPGSVLQFSPLLLFLFLLLLEFFAAFLARVIWFGHRMRLTLAHRSASWPFYLKAVTGEAKQLGYRLGKGQVTVLWETAKAEITSGNARPAGRRLSVSRLPRRAARRKSRRKRPDRGCAGSLAGRRCHGNECWAASLARARSIVRCSRT